LSLERQVFEDPKSILNRTLLTSIEAEWKFPTYVDSLPVVTDAVTLTDRAADEYVPVTQKAKHMMCRESWSTYNAGNAPILAVELGVTHLRYSMRTPSS
jgi:hypothetical protein